MTAYSAIRFTFANILLVAMLLTVAGVVPHEHAHGAEDVAIEMAAEPVTSGFHGDSLHVHHDHPVQSGEIIRLADARCNVSLQFVDFYSSSPSPNPLFTLERPPEV